MMYMCIDAMKVAAARSQTLAFRLRETTVLMASYFRETVSLFANYTSSKGVETVENPLDLPLGIPDATIMRLST